MSGFDDFIARRRMLMAQAAQSAPSVPSPGLGGVPPSPQDLVAALFQGVTSGASVGPPMQPTPPPPAVDPALIAALYQVTQYNRGNVYNSSGNDFNPGMAPWRAPAPAPSPTQQVAAQIAAGAYAGGGGNPQPSTQPEPLPPPDVTPQPAAPTPTPQGYVNPTGQNVSLVPGFGAPVPSPGIGGATDAPIDWRSDDGSQGMNGPLGQAMQWFIQNNVEPPDDFPLKDTVMQQISVSQANTQVQQVHAQDQASGATATTEQNPAKRALNFVGDIAHGIVQSPQEAVKGLVTEAAIAAIQHGMTSWAPADQKAILDAAQNGGIEAAWDKIWELNERDFPAWQIKPAEIATELGTDPWNYVGLLEKGGAAILGKAAEVVADSGKVQDAADTIRAITQRGDLSNRAGDVETAIRSAIASPNVDNAAKRALTVIADHAAQSIPSPQLAERAAILLEDASDQMLRGANRLTLVGKTVGAPAELLNNVSDLLTERALRAGSRGVGRAIQKAPFLPNALAKPFEMVGTLSERAGKRIDIAGVGEAAQSAAEAALRRGDGLLPDHLTQEAARFAPLKDGSQALGKTIKYDVKTVGGETVAKVMTRNKGVWSVDQEFRSPIGDQTAIRQAQQRAIQIDAEHAAARAPKPKPARGAQANAIVPPTIAPDVVAPAADLTSLPPRIATRLQTEIAKGVRADERPVPMIAGNRVTGYRIMPEGGGSQTIPILHVLTSETADGTPVAAHAIAQRAIDALNGRIPPITPEPSVAPVLRGTPVAGPPAPEGLLRPINRVWSPLAAEPVKAAITDAASRPRFDLNQFFPKVEGVRLSGANMVRPIDVSSVQVNLTDILPDIIAREGQGSGKLLTDALNGTKSPDIILLSGYDVSDPNGAYKYIIQKGAEDLIAAAAKGRNQVTVTIKNVGPLTHLQSVQPRMGEDLTRLFEIRPPEMGREGMDRFRPTPGPRPEEQAIGPNQTTYVSQNPLRAAQTEADLSNIVRAPDGAGFQTTEGLPVQRVPLWQTDLALDRQAKQTLSRVFTRGQYAGRQLGDVVMDAVRMAQDTLTNGWETGSADSLPDAITNGAGGTSDLFTKMIAAGKPATEDATTRRIAQAASKLVQNAVEADLGYNAATKEMSQLRKLLTPIVDRIRLLPQMAKQAILYNPASGSLIWQNLLGNTTLLAAQGRWGAITESLSGGFIKATYKQIQESGKDFLEDDAYTQLLDRLELPHSADVFSPHGKDAMTGLDRQTAWEKFFSSRAQQEARRAGADPSAIENMTHFFAHPVVRDWAITMDSIFRKGVHLDAMKNTFVPDARKTLLAGVEPTIKDAVESALPVGDEVGPEALRNALNDAGVEGVVSQRVSQQWANLLGDANRKGIALVNETMFSLDETNADALLNKIFTFHWWASRASLYYLRTFIRNPLTFHVFQQMGQQLSEYADSQPDMPPRFRGFLKLLNTPLGLTILANPVAMAATWTMFQQDRNTTAADATWIDSLVHDTIPFKYLMLNQMLDAALNLAGAYGDAFAPDPLATYGIRGQVGAALNFISAHAGGPVLPTPYEDFWEHVREATSGVANAIAPQFFQHVLAVNGNQFESDRLNYRILVLSQRQGGDEATIMGRALAAKENPDDPLYREAQQDVANIEGVVAILKSPLLPTAGFQPKILDSAKQTAQNLVAATKDSLVPPTPGTPEYNAQHELKLMRGGSDQADQLNFASSMWDQTLIDSPDLQAASDAYNQAYTNAQGLGLTGADASNWATVQVMQQGLYPQLQQYRLLRGEFEQAFPAYAAYKDWVRQVSDQYPDLQTYRDTVSNGNPAARAYFDSATSWADTPDKMDSATLSMGAYMAIHGIRASIFDPTTPLSTNTAPYDALAAGGGAGGGGAPSDPSMGFYGDLAKYGAEQQSFNTVLGMMGLPPDAQTLANPYMRQAVNYKLNTYGVTPPSVPKEVGMYQNWSHAQPPGNPTDPASFLAWEQQYKPALMGSLLQPPTDLPSALAQYQGLQQGVIPNDLLAYLMGVQQPQNLLPDMLPESVRNFAPGKTGTP